MNLNPYQFRKLAEIHGQIWAIRPDAIAGYAASAMSVDASLEISMEDFFPMRNAMSIENGIATIEIKGALSNRIDGIEEKLGFATRYSTIEREIAQAKAQGAQGIVYRVDSPGGSVAGLKEASEAMMQSGLPSVAHCSGMACSAGYYLASSAGGIIASPSAEVGNIGTILSWADLTNLWRAMGVEWKALVNSGADLKSTFHLEPDAQQLQFLQASIDDAGDDFRRHVESRRDGINPEVFRAGWYNGAKAGEMGLIDATGNYDEAVEYVRKKARLS